VPRRCLLFLRRYYARARIDIRQWNKNNRLPTGEAGGVGGSRIAAVKNRRQLTRIRRESENIAARDAR